ncbi:MAG: hypothetical protein JJ861_03005 [Rhizobiales bacterium]|nr:hypothetical protein [Hyphomicrobiales bacterium]MBO6911007.1 hypothetical protein [Hyphomicrobiales bacterium]
MSDRDGFGRNLSGRSVSWRSTLIKLARFENGGKVVFEPHQAAIIRDGRVCSETTFITRIEEDVRQLSTLTAKWKKLSKKDIATICF